MIFSTVLHLWGLWGPLDRLHHWHLSFRLSCLDERHLALHHWDLNGVLRCLDHGDMISHSNRQGNNSVDDTLSVLDLWELHGLLFGRMPSTSPCVMMA